jgi:hypothetical protein
LSGLFLCGNFWRSWHNFCAKNFLCDSSAEKQKAQNVLILQMIFTVRAVGIPQAKDVLSEQKHLTKTKAKG